MCGLQCFLAVKPRLDGRLGGLPAHLADPRGRWPAAGPGDEPVEGRRGAGSEGLESLCKNLHKRGCALILCNLNTQPESLIRRSGFGDEVGPNNLCSDLYSALARARQLLPRLSDEDQL